MHLVEKNELINNINNKLQKVKISSKNDNKTLINGMIHDLNSSLNTNIWEEFEIYFQSVHEEFYNKLNKLYPHLSKNEKRICAFLRLKMTTKEISFVTKQSQASINMARSRLRKKLGITGTNVEMLNFLTNL
jgi:DNA-binding CsgD family transcriptional regulator